MNLLEEPLPVLSLLPDLSPDKFFDRCEKIAASQGYRVDRRRAQAGVGHEQLNLYLGDSDEGYPMVRMVAAPRTKGRLDLDVVARWSNRPPSYDEYLGVAKAAYRKLLGEYAAEFGVRLRVGVPRRPVPFDPSILDCNRINYAHDKFQEAIRSLAVGPGDIRERLGSAYIIIHPVRPDDLPPPLNRHLEWIAEQLTWRDDPYKIKGTVGVTLDAMRRSTGSKIAKRILALADALDQLTQLCRERSKASRTVPHGMV